MKEKAALWAALGAAALILAYNWSLRRALHEPDEAAWIFSSYYYRVAFLERDPASEAWRHPDAVDHPPLAKYVFGAFLTPVGGVARSLQAKEWWAQMALRPLEREAFLGQLRALIPPRALHAARLPSTLAILSSCALVAAIAARALSPGAGALACLLLVLAPLARMAAGMATADALFMALTLAATLAHMRWAERPKSWPAAALCGVLAGLLFSTKISGLLAAALLLAYPRPRAKSAVALLAAALVAFALNPTLCADPWGATSAMFRHRWEAVALQREVFPGAAFAGLGAQLLGFLKGLFAGPELFSRLTGLLTAGLAAAGLAALGTRRLKLDTPARRCLALHAAAWIAATALTYRLAWTRYLVPALPFVCLLAAAGFEAIRQRARRRP